MKGVSRSTVRTCLFVAASLLVAAAPGSADAAPATTSADVCASNADPCNVTSSFEITPGAVLDFGVRSVSVSGAGKFDFNRHSGSILCGSFTASTTSAAIDANGVSPLGGTSSGSVSIEARRLCSSGDPATPCVSLSDCQLGGCDTRRCETNPSRTCTSDANCNLGTCGANKRCSGSTSFVRCNTNADCFFGACDPQLTCRNRAVNPASCASNSDCDFGICSVGTASITMGGSIVGNSDNPASIALRAADNVTITKPVNVSTTSSQSDGGELLIEAAAGSITVSGALNASGGAASQGGFVKLLAGTDVTAEAEINADGGDFDGGSVAINAMRDVTVGRSILASSNGGSGYGGEISIQAGRDLAVDGLSALNKAMLQTNGHTDVENFAGDGGIQALHAGRDLAVGAFVMLQGNGAAPDGRGGEMLLSAGGNALLEGGLQARSTGSGGEGGFLEVAGLGELQVAPEAEIDLRGGSSGGGRLGLSGQSATRFHGTADVAGTAGKGGLVAVESGGPVTFSGTAHAGGSGVGEISVLACSIDLTSTAVVDNDSGQGVNEFTSRGAMRFAIGSLVHNANSGNVLRYRSPVYPPVLDGTITPAPQILLDPSLAPCGVCGDNLQDQYEQCDDGNATSGDGCDANCTTTGCGNGIATEGEECDDGNELDTDACTSACEAARCGDGFVRGGIEACDDANFDDTDGCLSTCTTASCGDGVLQIGVEECDGGPCCQGNCTLSAAGTTCRAAVGVCDFAETCSGSSATCPANVLAPTATVCRAASGACDVAETCTGSSPGCPANGFLATGTTCRAAAGACDVAETCSGTSGSCPANAFAGNGTPCATDGNLCTDDLCSGASSICQHPANNAACSDGVFCNGSDTCSGGSCTEHTGDPCSGPDGDGDCAESCDEIADTCTAPDTDSSPCDDGLACTAGDSCQAGACTAAQNTCEGCGNGSVDGQEQCDDGNTVDTDACLSSCLHAACGDGIVRSGSEECDDGNTADGDGCSKQCEDQQVCGDPTGDGKIFASDALRVLQKAVGLDVDCPTWLCDVDATGTIAVGDALKILRRSINIPTDIHCGSPTALVIRITTPATLGSLQFDVDYQGAAGEIEGEGSTVECQALQAGVDAAYNDQPGRVLSASMVSLSGIHGPAGIVRCGFVPGGNVDPEDFAVNVLDATLLDGGVAAEPTIRVIPD